MCKLIACNNACKLMVLRVAKSFGTKTIKDVMHTPNRSNTVTIILLKIMVA